MSIICPKCKRTTVVFEDWVKNDLVAVCRSVRRCGYRKHLPGGKKLAEHQKQKLTTYKFGQ